MKRGATALGHGLAGLLLVSSLLIACSKPDDAEATAIFADCLRRNGIVAEDVQVTMGSDGKVEGISVTIVSEGNVAYEPALRLSCTEEVEINLG